MIFERWWNSASVFWKAYLLAVVVVGCIIVVGEFSEAYWAPFFGPELSYWQREIGMWIVATVVPTALGCLWLTRLFTAPLRRLTANIGRLADGDLSIRTDAEDAGRQDELGTLVRAFNVMAERLEVVRRAERRLLVDISHELRSPLTRMGVAIALLRRDAEPRSLQEGGAEDGRLDRLELEMERMNTLIGQLLRHAREEAGEQPRKRVALDVLLEDVMADALFELGADEETGVQPVRVTLSEGAAGAWVWGDADLLQRAIDNVVRNALRYSPPGKAVELALMAARHGEQSGWLLTITDEGQGVPEAALPDLFRPFYRVDEARTRESGGVGLGLAIAEQTVRLHGGTISAALRQDGRPGLVVSVFLPAVEKTS